MNEKFLVNLFEGGRSLAATVMVANTGIVEKTYMKDSICRFSKSRKKLILTQRDGEKEPRCRIDLEIPLETIKNGICCWEDEEMQIVKIVAENVDVTLMVE